MQYMPVGWDYFSGLCISNVFGWKHFRAFAHAVLGPWPAGWHGTIAYFSRLLGSSVSTLNKRHKTLNSNGKWNLLIQKYLKIGKIGK